MGVNPMPISQRGVAGRKKGPPRAPSARATCEASYAVSAGPERILRRAGPGGLTTQ